MSRVIDASALLALLQDEPGGDRVAEALPDAIISAVNIAEVVTKLCDSGFQPGQARETLEMLSLNIVDFDLPQAVAVGALRRATRAFGLSLGDRACLALAAQSGGPAMTTDGIWVKLEIGVTVELIR